jgi:hypothetical protein
MARLSAAHLLAAGLTMTAWAGEVPLAFQGNLFDQLPEPFFPTMFRVRDLDGDGFPDLVIAGRDPDDRLMTRRGLGNGRFEAFQTLAAPGFTDWLEVGDVDGDGMSDIVTAWRGDVPRLVVYRGIGAGLFDEAVVLAGVEWEGTGRDPQGVALGDFDGDGDLDIAVSNYISQSVDVFSNMGKLAFERTSRVRLSTYLGGYGYPRIVASADMDGDGDLDLVANEMGGSRIAVLRNEHGSFVRSTEYRVPQIGNERPGIAGMQLADGDGDGDIDVLCPALLLETTQKLVMFVNDGSGRLTERLVGESSPTGYNFAVCAADFDGDGDLDAVAGAALPGTICIARRTGDGPFTFEVDLAYQWGQLIRHLDAVDVDGDCDLDIVGIDGPSRSVFVRRNVTPQQSGCSGGLAALEDADAPMLLKPARGAVPQVDRDHDGAFTAADVAIWLAEISRAGVIGGNR